MDTNKVNGFTLVELMITVLIVGVLAAIALPSYNRYLVREYRTEVKGDMVLIGQKLAAYKLANNNYSTLLSNSAIYGSTQFKTSSGVPLYNLSLDTTTVAGAWTLTATPVPGSKQVLDGSVLLNDQGWRCWTKTIAPCTLSATSNWDDH